ncbi:Fur family transcriptional regulator [Aerococcus tenax]|uniref:Fur family transcriptional regulator n=1 Tax=Aerococcus tenax TaxID=3078812 RepID=UPI0018A70BE7|nr:Fur family transcriptional regulator [Aerococcus tenax]
MSEFVKNAMNQLNDLGYKYTQRRADMLAVFDQDINHFKSAKDVQQAMKKGHPNISFDTIYRNLRLFTDYDLLEENEIDGEMVFRQHCDPILGHHHHFVCNHCGKTVPVRLGDLSYYSQQLPGYEINGHSFQLFGLCPDCLAESKKQS